MPLIDLPQPRGIVVNKRCLVQDDGDIRVVIVHGTPVFSFHREDRASEAFFVGQALASRIAKPGELARALSKGVATMHRIRKRYEERGIEGLVAKKRGPKGARLGPAREAAIRKGHGRGMSPHRTRAIADLCRVLDESETRFPGTDLRVRYAVRR